jgi:hypothetical protein
LSEAPGSHAEDGEYNLLESEGLFFYRQNDTTIYKKKKTFLISTDMRQSKPLPVFARSAAWVCGWNYGFESRWDPACLS